jgi:hypothetical protein
MPPSGYVAIRWQCQSACAEQARKVYQARISHTNCPKRA